MISKLIFICLTIITTSIFHSNTFAQSCTCLEELEFLMEKTKQNYIGYQQKVSNNISYRPFADSLQKEAKKIYTSNCLPVLQAYTDFFEDPHMMVYFAPEPAEPQRIRAMFASAEKINLSEADIIKYLNTSKRDKIEGIWTDDSQTYKIAIFKSRTMTRDFAGIVLQADSIFWMPGQVKIEIKKNSTTYTANYYFRDHSSTELPLTVNTHSIALPDGLGLWNKLYPKVKTPDVKDTQIMNNPGFSCRALNNESVLLTLADFAPENKSTIDSLIETNRDIILRSKNLIIDIRDNWGGAVPSFEKLIPFLYTGPIVIEGNSILATNDNIAAFKNMLLFPNVVENIRLTNELEQTIKMLEEKKGQVVTLPADTVRQNSLCPNPAKVAIITNENTASAAELFVLQARQSKKVTIFGDKTAGAADYLDMTEMPMPCGSFVFAYPLSRNDRILVKPAPAARISPDIKIPGQTKDWIAFVLKKL